MLYELLCGERPFVADSDAGRMGKILSSTPAPPLGAKAPLAPPNLCAAVMKALEKEREARWQTAEEFSNSLEDVVSSLGETNSNSTTAAYMRALFGDAEDPVLRIPLANPPPLATPHLAVTVAEVVPALATSHVAATVADHPPEPRVAPEPDLSALRVSTLSESIDAPGEPAKPDAGSLELDRPPRGDVVAPVVEQSAPASRRWIAIAVVAGIAVAAGLFVVKGGHRGSQGPVAAATISISSQPPGAHLIIDSAPVGTTPWEGSNLYSGDTKYELSAPGRVTRRGTFHGGQEVHLSIDLPPKPR